MRAVVFLCFVTSSLLAQEEPVLWIRQSGSAVRAESYDCLEVQSSGRYRLEHRWEGILEGGLQQKFKTGQLSSREMEQLHVILSEPGFLSLPTPDLGGSSGEVTLSVSVFPEGKPRRLLFDDSAKVGQIQEEFGKSDRARVNLPSSINTKELAPLMNWFKQMRKRGGTPDSSKESVCFPSL